MPRHESARGEIARADMRARAIGLRRAGASYRAIAAELGCNAQTAYRAVQKALRDLPADDVAALRTLHGDRLDDMTATLWPDRADPKVAAVLVNIERRHAALFGLDLAPQPGVPGGMTIVIDSRTITPPTALPGDDLEVINAAIAARTVDADE